MRVEHQAEPQPAIGPEGDRAGLVDLVREGVELLAKRLQHVLLRIRLVADGDGIAGMGGQRRQVLLSDRRRAW